MDPQLLWIRLHLTNLSTCLIPWAHTPYFVTRHRMIYGGAKHGKDFEFIMSWLLHAICSLALIYIRGKRCTFVVLNTWMWTLQIFRINGRRVNRYTLYQILGCSRWFCNPPPLIWGSVLLYLQWSKGGCCSISDYLFCSFAVVVRQYPVPDLKSCKMIYLVNVTDGWPYIP